MVYKVNEIYWAFNEDEKVMMPFMFNNDQTKLKNLTTGDVLDVSEHTSKKFFFLKINKKGAKTFYGKLQMVISNVYNIDGNIYDSNGAAFALYNMDLADKYFSKSYRFGSSAHDDVVWDDEQLQKVTELLTKSVNAKKQRDAEAEKENDILNKKLDEGKNF